MALACADRVCAAGLGRRDPDSSRNARPLIRKVAGGRHPDDQHRRHEEDLVGPGELREGELDGPEGGRRVAEEQAASARACRT